MRSAKALSSGSVPAGRGKRAEVRMPANRAEELMQLALDAAQAQNLPDFLQRFSARAGRMLNASWCAVAVFTGTDVELHSNLAGGEKDPFAEELRRAILEAARKPHREISILPLAELPSPAGLPAGPGSEAVLVRIGHADGERLGCLCLVRRARPMEASDRRLLLALASHAALSLVSFRRFSQLERSKRQWVEDIDAISDYIVVHDRRCRIVRTNRSLASVLGAPPVALVGEPMSRLRQLIEGRGELRSYEETLRRKDGSLLHTLQNVTAVRDAKGQIAQIRGLMLDVTEQKNFQAQLQRERDFNQKILNTTQSMILVLDTAGLIAYANPRCYETGYRKDEMIGHRLVDWVEPTHRPEFEAALETTAHGQQVENLELRVRRGDDSMGHFSVSLSPMRDEQDTVNSLVVVMTDITDAVMLQAKLAHSEKMATIGRLVSGVAHEVNNPLAAILGFTDLLLENPEVPVNAKEDLQIILHETQRTKDIVQDLLSFARQRPARREAVQVNAVLRQTIKLRSYDFASHGVEVIEALEENLELGLGDAEQLQQVFLNILNNAYDAVQETQRRGHIEIRTAQSGHSVEVSVSDNGIGISEPERIFDPFYTTKQAGKGTGLGLSICYGIVRAHGGEIQCWNNDGEGSTFVVRLPAATEAGIATAKEAGR